MNEEYSILRIFLLLILSQKGTAEYVQLKLGSKSRKSKIRDPNQERSNGAEGQENTTYRLQREHGESRVMTPRRKTEIILI